MEELIFPAALAAADDLALQEPTKTVQITREI